MVEVGEKAPAFSLKDQDGRTHKLADYTGRPVVLYFYPKDDTPGCTREACAFRDALPQFEKGKAAVLGVSILDTKSKAKFAAKHKVNFPLLAEAAKPAPPAARSEPAPKPAPRPTQGTEPRKKP